MFGAIIVIIVTIFGIVTEAQLGGSMTPLYIDRETEAQREVGACTELSLGKEAEL